MNKHLRFKKFINLVKYTADTVIITLKLQNLGIAEYKLVSVTKGMRPKSR